MKKKRTAKIIRKTKETNITLDLTIDGKGVYNIKTPLPFFTHMLESFCRHGLFNIKLIAHGDVEVDDHHLVEDVGLVLGAAFKDAVKDKKGMRRFGHFSLPMDDALATVALDFSGRPYLVYKSPITRGKIKDFDVTLVKEFFQAFANVAGLNLHIHVPYGDNKHHVVEAVFKAFARALDMATQTDPRVSGLASTKGAL